MTMKIEGFDKFLSLGQDSADAFTKSSAVAVKGFEELAKVSQALTARNVEKADAAVKALFAVKSPAEFADLQGKLAREAVESMIADSRKLAEISTSVITAALEPLNARIAAFQSLTKTAA